MEELEKKEDVAKEAQESKTEKEETPPARRVENRFISITSPSVLAFKRKLEMSAPIPVKFLSLQAEVEIDEANPSNIVFKKFMCGVAVAEGKGLPTDTAKVYHFTFPPITPPQVDITRFYILAAFLLLSFHLHGIRPSIQYVPFLDSLTLFLPESGGEGGKEGESGEGKRVTSVWEVQIPFRELLLFPTGEHLFFAYKRQRVRLIKAKLWELSQHLCD